MKYTALIPVKALHEAKSRLTAHLTQTQRADLVLEMLYHVIHTLHESAVLAQVTVVSPDSHVLERAQEWGARARFEEQAGHNPALTRAAMRELAEGATALLTLSADLPLLQAEDIREMVQQSLSYDIVLAPSRDRTGTNALLLRPPLVVPYVFGLNSFQRYQAEAEQRHLRIQEHTRIGLSLDIDTPEDLLLQHQYESIRKTENALCI